MKSHSAKLRADAERIWRAGVAAVLPANLVPEHIFLEGKWLTVGDEVLDCDAIRRIAVVGAGKAAGAMAVALETVLGPLLLEKKQVSGWVNVPADCLVPTHCIHLHAARAPGVNEPSAAGVEGTRQILEKVASLGSEDVCFCLLTGGASALLPAPVAEISLDEKIRLTRLISGAGGNIEQLNIVRQNLSLVKGGGLARACRARQLITLVISDVLGDPLDLIGSGPTVQKQSTAADALAVLRDLAIADDASIASVVKFLAKQAAGPALPQHDAGNSWELILGNNATAVDGAGIEAEKLGYSHAMVSASQAEGPAEDVGRHLASMAKHMRGSPGPDCLISGGEPTVKLVDEQSRGKGGRNQQLALAALEELGNSEGVCLLSGGTDGEDGPTDAAGAIVDDQIVAAATRRGLDSRDYLARNDSYTFFDKCDGLLKTGPTGTNVCDLRVVVVQQ